MIPSEYRLDQVAARLTVRLESTRRSYAGNPEGAAETFRRITDEVVGNAIEEYSADGFVDQPERHADFLRHEMLQTYLPRYTRIATAMTAREESGFGAGFLYGPAGRAILFVAVIGIGALLLRAPGPLVKLVPMIPLMLGVFVPDLLAWGARRRYGNEIVSLMTDLEHIQERAADYANVPVEPPIESLEDELERARRSGQGRQGGHEGPGGP